MEGSDRAERGISLWRAGPADMGQDEGVSLLLLILLIVLIVALAGGGYGYRGGVYRGPGLGLGGLLLIILIILLLVGAF